MNSWRSTVSHHKAVSWSQNVESDIDPHSEESEIIWKAVREITWYNHSRQTGRQAGQARQLSSLCLMIEMQPAFCHDLCALPVCKLQSTFCSYSLVSKDQLPSFWVSWRLLLQNKWNCIVCTHFYFVEMNICAPIFPRKWVLGDRWQHEHNSKCTHAQYACMHTHTC